MGRKVEIFEVGPRDGLQNEARLIPVAEKITFVDCLSRAGFRRIEVASFVSPKWVPQMASSAKVLTGIARMQGVSYAALTPNIQGFAQAMEANADEVAIFGSASEAFSKANINASIAESFERFAPIAEAAKALGVPMRGYVSCVTDCPYEGRVAPEQAALVAKGLYEQGCYEISLGDTIGCGDPERVTEMLRAVLQVVPADQLAGHFHDTSGLAFENIEASLEMGLRVFDAAVGGLGGCPYAPGAAGNVATERVHQRLLALGYETGLNAEVLEQAAEMAREMRQLKEGEPNEAV